MIEGTNNYYSPAEFNNMLGTVDELSLLVLADQVTTNPAGGAVTLTIQIEQSPDGAEWVNKAATPEVNGIAIPVVDGNAVEDRGGVPSATFVRLRANLAGTSPCAYVRIYVVGRGR